MPRVVDLFCGAGSAAMTFSTIMLDPPRDYGQRSCNRSSSGTGAATAHYPTMTLEQIAALPVQAIAAPDAHIYLWVTNGFLEYSWGLLNGWGFAPKSVLTWVKTYPEKAIQQATLTGVQEPIRQRVRIGMGRWYLGATEHILFGVRGKLPLLAKAPNVIHAPIGRHSAKPTAAYELIERCSPGPYAEVFARIQRPGWAVWGNEVTSTFHLTQ